MPRNHTPAASTLRNRNRITNKTRLKIYQGSLEVDAVLIPDEDEEKHRLTNLVAGVDAEDANEHHLQEVLSAARHAAARGKVPTDKPVQQSAYIPTPDSTGVVEEYVELYPVNRWKDPITYVCDSSTVEECIDNGLVGGFTYYMDERDKDWLDKNNEEARGEGTSVQGAVSASTTRTSARSAKAKGKEPEASQPAPITEDEFELVMGLFEKITHERTEFLHHGLQNGMEFPAFSDYQDVYSAPLPPATFATFTVPSWIPLPSVLLRIAKTVYPYWKERRTERGGHRIIPTLNGDESDTLNESYICFRRRESKAVRKTRASQASSSEKLARLQAELAYPLEMAKKILERENKKKETSTSSKALWEARLALVDLKRRFPAFAEKSDEDLLVDKERPAKQPKIEPPRIAGTLKITTQPPRPEQIIKPRERYIQLRDTVDQMLARQREVDHHVWEDQIDNPYQNQPTPYQSRLFKYIPPQPLPSSSSSDRTDDEPSSPPPTVPRRAIRSRYGRGGRMYIDRRDSVPRSVGAHSRRSTLFDLEEGSDREPEQDRAERLQRLQAQWKYDQDDVPAAGPLGSEEQDRVLIDDYDTKYVRCNMSLLSERDHACFVTDPTLLITTPEGKIQGVAPYRLGSYPRRDIRYHPNAAMAAQLANGTPVSQVRKMAPPVVGAQMKISNGGMRSATHPVPITSAAASAQPTPVTPTSHVSPPQPLPVPVPQHPVNGISRAAISMPHVEVPKPDVITTPAIPPSVVAITQSQSSQSDTSNTEHANHNNANNANGNNPPAGATPPRPKTATLPQQHVAPLGVPPNGYHLTPMPGLTNGHAQPVLPTGLSVQQMQSLKTAFANMQGPELAALQNAGRAMTNSYLHANGASLQQMAAAAANLKQHPVANGRPMQWAAMGSPMQRPASVVNGIVGADGQVNGMTAQQAAAAAAAAAGLNHATPVRSPSTNGTRPQAMRNGVHVNGMSPHMQHSPSPLPNISQAQSPPRVPMTPNMGMASPSLQQQQPVGTTQSGY